MRSGQCFKDNVHFKFSIEATEHNEEIAKDDMREEHLTPDDFIAADFVNKTFDGYRHVTVDDVIKHVQTDSNRFKQI